MSSITGRSACNAAASAPADADESTILASLGTTSTSVSEYESAVVRDATLSTAPRLDGLGVPDLRGLAPSYGIGGSRGRGAPAPGDADSEHFLTALSDVRSELARLERGGIGNDDNPSESDRANVLRLKEQMLLIYLAQIAKMPAGEVGVDFRSEAESERRRRAGLLARADIGNAGTSNGRGADAGEGGAAAAAASAVDDVNRGAPYDESSGPATGAGGSSLDSLSAQQRLEQIKKGWLQQQQGSVNVTSSSATASFGGQALRDREASLAMSRRRRSASTGTNSSNDTTASASSAPSSAAGPPTSTPRRRLGPTMAMKLQIDIDDGIEGEREEMVEAIERRKKRREERTERRRRRMMGKKKTKATGGGSGSSSSRTKRRKVTLEEDARGGDNDDADTDEAEFEFGSGSAASGANTKTNNVAETVEQQQGRPQEPQAADASSSAAENTPSVTCPLCQEIIPVDSSEGGAGGPVDADAALSAHIDECQRRRRSGRSSTSTSRARASSRRSSSPPSAGWDRGAARRTRSNRAAAAAAVNYRECVGDGSNDDEEEETYDADLDDGAYEDEGEEKKSSDAVVPTSRDEGRLRKRLPSLAIAAATAPVAAPSSTSAAATFGSSGMKRPRPAAAATGRSSFPGIGNSSASDSGSLSDGIVGDFCPQPPNDSSSPRPTVDDSDDNLPFRTAVDDLLESNYDDRVDTWVESGVKSMKCMAERDQNEAAQDAVMLDGGMVVPRWMNERLFGYQRTGLRWMWELHRQGAGGIVGDEMGLGKTVQVCSYLGAAAASRKLNSVLVISPATMLSHWLSELSVWAPGLRRILIHKSGETDGLSRSVSTTLLRKLDKWLRGARRDRVNEPIDERDYDEFNEDSFCGTGWVVVTTYDNIRKCADTWTGHPWDYVVMDEGQKIRNPDADVTLACKRFRTPHRLLLSGTPIQNDLRELWSLFDFVFPGRLGTLPAFETEFADPIKRGGYSNASPMQVQLAYRCALVLRDLINPYLLRRQKKDIQEVSRMPGKTEQVLFCRLSSRQRMMYEVYLKSEDVMSALRGSNQSFRAITVLRKICNHPDLVCGTDQASFDSFLKNGYVDENDLDSSSDEFDDDESFCDEDDMVTRSGKLEVLAKILPLWKKQGHRVLIFTQWTKMLSIIQRFTQMQGWKFGRLDGKTNVASRQRMVDDFNNDENYFGMLLTTRTGGVGLNLVGANRIILYDPDWNPQTDAQARERAWRFGQKNAVAVYRLITAGAIEERIYHRQIFKNAISSAVLVDPKQRRLFSQRDLRDLFTLKADVGSMAKGGDGFTETGEITKGKGVVDVHDINRTSSDAEVDTSDNQDTLEIVMKSKGLAGIFDHDFVDKPASKKSVAVREMEDQARVVANCAARALRESTADQAPEFPTWTGSSATAVPRRFGGGRRLSAASTPSSGPSDIDGSFGGSRSAGVASMASQGRQASSGALLSHLQQRRNHVATGAATAPTGGNGDTTHNAQLLQSMKEFIRRRGGNKAGGGPTTDELLKEFNSIPNSDAAVFRRMLLSIAHREDGKWRLKNT